MDIGDFHLYFWFTPCTDVSFDPPHTKAFVGILYRRLTTKTPSGDVIAANRLRKNMVIIIASSMRFGGTDLKNRIRTNI